MFIYVVVTKKKNCSLFFFFFLKFFLELISFNPLYLFITSVAFKRGQKQLLQNDRKQKFTQHFTNIPPKYERVTMDDF